MKMTNTIQFSTSYPVDIQKIEDYYALSVVDFPCIYSKEKDINKALGYIQEQLDQSLIDLLKSGDNIPDPTSSKSNVLKILPSPSVSFQVLLRKYKTYCNFTVRDMAKKLGISLGRYQQIENGHASLKAIDKITKKLQLSLKIELLLQERKSEGMG